LQFWQAVFRTLDEHGIVSSFPSKSIGAHAVLYWNVFSIVADAMQRHNVLSCLALLLTHGLGFHGAIRHV